MRISNRDLIPSRHGKGHEKCECCKGEYATECTPAGLLVCRECADDLVLSYATMPRLAILVAAARGVNLQPENDR